MALLWPLLATLLLQAPEIEATTLEGESVGGQIVSLDTQTAVVQTEDGRRDIPLARLLTLSFPHARVSSPPRGLSEVTLLGGGRFFAESVQATREGLQFTSPSMGEVQVPLQSAAHIRFQNLDSTLAETWRDLTRRELRSDLLVIRKERDGAPFLDFIDGVVSEFDEEKLTVLLDGEAVTVKRDGVFGVVYYRRNPAPPSDAFRMQLATGESAPFSEVRWVEDSFRVTLANGASVSVPPEQVTQFDFSQGKVLYLSDAEPREVEYTPFFDVTWEYRRDMNLDGGPLRLGGKAYRRGLALHSRTRLLYRLGGDYRRFHAVMGIDQNVAPLGHVHVVIRGDGRPLLEKDVGGSDEPQPLDLDVTGVRDLEILVDFGEGLDIADHLDLADARVMK